jgi:hypothetical protein
VAQLTIYLDDESIRRIEEAAMRDNSSVSRWVKNRLLLSLEDQWPSRYFDLFGALGEDDLQRPPQPDFTLDGPRETL